MKKFILLLIFLSGCVGTDFINDPIVGEKIILSLETLALTPGEQGKVSAEYFDQYGLAREVAIIWESSNTQIAEVNNSGVVTGKTLGQCLVQPSYQNFLGPQIQITVVADPLAVATVTIQAPATSLATGDKVQLQVMVKNIMGEVLTGRMVEWFSENNAIVTVSATGLVEAAGNGTADIHAKVEGVKSNMISFTVSSLVRTAPFVSSGGYKTIGEARLEVVNNQLILTFSDNFDTDFALGTFIYLANSTNGPMERSGGFEVAQIFSDGGKTFNQ